MNVLEELVAWQKARELRKRISVLVRMFPDYEKYKLIDQIKRSSRSISANIAEGFGRFHYQENIQFCRQARGSLTETLDHLYVALDEEYISEDEFKEHNILIIETIKVLNGYISYLKKAKNND